MKRLYISIFEYFAIVFSLLLTLLLISGVAFLESIRFAFVAGLICVSGGQLWKIVSKNYVLSALEFIGMGLAFGSAISSFLQLALRTTPLNNIAWMLTCVLIPVGLKIEYHKCFCDPHTHQSSEKDYSTVLTFLDLIAVVAFALAWHWWWIYPFAVAALVTSITLRLHRRKKTTTTLRASMFGLLVLIPVYFWCTTLRGRNDLWRVISHDQVFSESLSWSLTSFGRGDSPFLSGIEINYHWLALHWAGLLTQSSNGGSWISVTQVIPILSYLGIFSLLFAISSKMITRTSISILIAIPFVLLSNTFGFNLERYLVSPTFQFSCVWMLATILAFVTYANSPSGPKMFSVGVMLFATFGGKVMNGLVVLIGLMLALMTQIKIHDRKQNLRILFAIAIALFSTASAYLYFFRSTGIANTNTLKVGLQVGRDVGVIYPDSGVFLRLLAAVIFNMSVSLPVLIALIYTTRMRQKHKPLSDTMSAAMFFGILGTSITTHEGASQLYFIMSSIVISFAVFPLMVMEIKSDKSTLLKGMIISVAAGFGSQTIWNQSIEVSDYRTSVYLKVVAVSLVPSSSLALWMWARYQSPSWDRANKKFIPMLCSIVLFSSIAIGVYQRIEKLPTASQSLPSIQDDPTLITGSKDHLEVLYWIRQNTNPLDVVAINRFCIPGIDTCIMKWQLVSAISHRRILIEGGYGSPMQLSPGEIQDRYMTSYKFSTSPDSRNLRYLCDKGVRWFFYDSFDSLPVDDWSPYATVAISNRSVSLLQLNCI